MQLSKKRLMILVLLLLIVGVFLSILYTNAKYTSQVEGEITASIAKYVFDVSAGDSYSSMDTFKNLVLAQTCDEATLTDGKIAPGVSGSFDIVVNTEDAETGIHYAISFNSNTDKKLPVNLRLFLDGNEWKFEDGIDGIIDANSDSQIATHTITWEWVYETRDENGSSVAGDIADTVDGTNSFDYSYTITAIGTQTRPISN